MKAGIKIMNLALAVVVVGVMVVIWVAFDPSGLPASIYTERQQTMIRLLNVPMPLLGALAILLTFLSSYMLRDNRGAAFLLALAGALLIGSGMVTRFCNQPINAIVMTWDLKAPPTNWEMLRDQWWRWHIIRSALGLLALGLTFWGYFHESRLRSPNEKTA